jgi:hypothetical protein
VSDAQISSTAFAGLCWILHFIRAEISLKPLDDIRDAGRSAPVSL